MSESHVPVEPPAGYYWASLPSGLTDRGTRNLVLLPADYSVDGDHIVPPKPAKGEPAGPPWHLWPPDGLERLIFEPRMIRRASRSILRQKARLDRARARGRAIDEAVQPFRRRRS